MPGLWTTDPVSDFRAFLSDGPYDHPVKRKHVFPKADGTKNTFYTFDDRLVAGSLIVYVDDAVVPATLTDPIYGAITITSAPAASTEVSVDYYYQWFFDSELLTFLGYGYTFVGQTTPAGIDISLQTAVLQHAGSQAYLKLAAKWVERAAHKFLLEDEPAKAEAEARAVHFSDLAKIVAGEARTNRQASYRLRQDRGYAPAFGRVLPRIDPYTPRR